MSERLAKFLAEIDPEMARELFSAIDVAEGLQDVLDALYARIEKALADGTLK